MPAFFVHIAEVLVVADHFNPVAVLAKRGEFFWRQGSG